MANGMISGPRTPKQMPNAEELALWFVYEPATGFIVWKPRADKNKTWNSRYAGKEAGCVAERGYKQIRLNGRGYRYHRVAWALAHGDCPCDFWIDHRDGDTSNNRLDNLRLASISDNSRNSKRRAGGLPRGVKRHHRGNTFEANIRIAPKKRIRLGSFPTAELAHAAYCEAAKKYHGEFARFD